MARYANLKQDDPANRPRSTAKNKYACFNCRIVQKAGGYGSHKGSTTCTRCGEPMSNCGTRWRFAKRSDVKAWKRDEEMFRRLREPRLCVSTHAPFAPHFSPYWPIVCSKRKQDQPSIWFF